MLSAHAQRTQKRRRTTGTGEGRTTHERTAVRMRGLPGVAEPASRGQALAMYNAIMMESMDGFSNNISERITMEFVWSYSLVLSFVHHCITSPSR